MICQGETCFGQKGKKKYGTQNCYPVKSFRVNETEGNERVTPLQ
jgi:hypothetical protein